TPQTFATHRRLLRSTNHAFHSPTAVAPINTRPESKRSKIRGPSIRGPIQSRFVSISCARKTQASITATTRTAAIRTSRWALASVPVSSYLTPYRRRTRAEVGHAIVVKASAIRAVIHSGSNHPDDHHQGTGSKSMNGYSSYPKRTTRPFSTFAAKRSPPAPLRQTKGAISRHFFGCSSVPFSASTVMVPSLLATTRISPSRLRSERKLVSARRVKV